MRQQGEPLTARFPTRAHGVRGDPETIMREEGHGAACAPAPCALPPPPPRHPAHRPPLPTSAEPAAACFPHAAAKANAPQAWARIKMLKSDRVSPIRSRKTKAAEAGAPWASPRGEPAKAQ